MDGLKQLARDTVKDFPDHFDPYEEPWEKFPHILSTRHFSRESIERLVFKDTMKTLFHLLDGSSISYLRDRHAEIVNYFFEPSTRTRMSFERAAHLLGAQTISTESGGLFSSAAKGESMPDTSRVISGVGLEIGYGDLIVVRHSIPHIIENEIAPFSRKPVINAGDGPNEHPTQGQTDTSTIYLRFGKIDGLSVAFIGDITYSRTIRSLCYMLSLFDGMKFYFVSPSDLPMQEDVKKHLEEKGIWYREEPDLRKVLPHAQVLYFTRLQVERFAEKDPVLYEKLKPIIPDYHLTPSNLDLVPMSSIVLHPLPIGNNEIDEKLKHDRRIWAFIQTEVGIATRMALINRIFKELGKKRMQENFKETVFGRLGWK